MDQQDSTRIARFRKAEVPNRMLRTTAEKSGFPQIAAIVAGKQYIDKTLYRSYLVEGKRSYDAVSVFARELVLAKVEVHFLSSVQVARDLRLSERNYDNTPEYMLALGSGYWVVAGHAEMDAHTRIETLEVESLLTRHANRGGGLVLQFDKAEEVMTGSIGFRQMAEAFDKIKV